MRNHKNASIKAKIHKLILIISLLLVCLGCFLAIVIFLNLFQSEKTNELKKDMNVLYEKSITETQEMTEIRAFNIANILKDKNLDDKNIIDTINSLQTMSENLRFAVYNTAYQLKCTTAEDVFLKYEDAAILKNQDNAFLGNQESGIWYYSKMAIVDVSDKTVGYVIVGNEVTDKDFVNYIKKAFYAEATIFYKDLRIVTTIQKDNKIIVGTKLNSKIAERMLREDSVYEGNAFILGKLYRTAYKSFGNPGEEPIGIIFVGERISNYTIAILKIIFSVIVIGVALLVISIKLADHWLELNIVRPMLDTTVLMTDIADGKVKYTDSSIENIHYNEFDNLLASINKMIYKLELSRKDIEHIAYFDDLTNLPNRFHLFLKKEASKVNEQTATSLLLLDVDDLYTVNNLYGRRIGDMLLLEIGRYIRWLMEYNEGMEGYRIGGGTFAFLITNKKGKEKIETIVYSIMNRFTKPFYYNEVSVVVTVSMGIAVGNGNETVEELLHHAELAMSEVKKANKNNFLFYQPEMSENILKQKQLELELKQAIERGEFYLVYQPKFNLWTKQFDSFEALIRWDNPKRGMVPPDEFISLAERSGLIVPIGKWVLQEACRVAKLLTEKKGYPFKMAVNISPIQVNREEFVDTILDALNEQELDPSQLELEITENLLMTSGASTVVKLRYLNKIGISVSVDDFGKGYSSLAYLKELPINVLKIDKMFVDGIAEDDNNMVRDIIRLGHNLNLNIVAEGVETVAQALYLENFGCDSIQGYYYSRPLTLEKLEEFLSKEK